MKKSKTQICSALIKLLKTEPYRKITVSQVCACAGVSRTAFYKNFTSMTADAFEESIREAKGAGMNDYITKPVEPQKLYSVLQKCME